MKLTCSIDSFSQTPNRSSKDRTPNRRYPSKVVDLNTKVIGKFHHVTIIRHNHFHLYPLSDLPILLTINVYDSSLFRIPRPVPPFSNTSIPSSNMSNTHPNIYETSPIFMRNLQVSGEMRLTI